MAFLIFVRGWTAGWLDGLRDVAVNLRNYWAEKNGNNYVILKQCRDEATKFLKSRSADLVVRHGWWATV